MTTRRQWLKTAVAAGAGLPLSLALADQLMAAPVSRAERLHGIEPLRNGKLVLLGSNENPYGPSDKARKAIVESMKEGNRYAHGVAQELKKVIAQREGVAPEFVLMGCGSSELLCLTGMTAGLEGGAVLSAFPTFRLLMDYATKFNARWDRVDLDANMVHDLEAMASAVKPDTKIIFVVNPNNPTGTIVDNDKLRSFCMEMAKKATVFADEAYIEFLDQHEKKSMVDLVKQGHNVIVSRTFSKVYGLAGLRVGYLIGQPDTLKKMAEKQIWGNNNQAGLAAAKASLDDKDFVTMTRKKNTEARQHLFNYLDSKKWSYGKSMANVVFFPAPIDGKTILEETEKKGYQIRVWDYQDKEWCRVSIGTLEEMKGFTKAFDQVIS
ncbi:MAG: histidinol-phosphate aminotransferase family protein [Cyclobacteriaceae bacterium]|nr:histidinol-phosphate aminotransferase family protein [Cyclobacteriaceae bacterium]UYN87184.1 MAG: histidinol-phosphate aminotransferase family protein [Cyclobacteriaceae bacterium]